MDTAIRTQRARSAETGGRLDDPYACRAFYDDALPRVYGYLLARCGGDVATAEDLTQEAFFSELAEIRRGAVVAAPVPWVLGIARHKLVDFYRRRGREETTAPPLSDDGPIDERPDHPAAAIAASANDGREQTLAVLAALPADQRAALVLRHMDGFAVPEVAAALPPRPRRRTTAGSRSSELQAAIR